MLKSELRKIYLDKRKSLSDKEIEYLSEKISHNLINYFDWSKITNAHIFLPIKKQKEINTQHLIEFLWREGKKVFLPKIIEGELVNCQLLPHTFLKQNSMGILEPEGGRIKEKINIDMVITPLVYCDKNGNRVGYGKGFYDKFFIKNKNALKVGVSLFPPKEEIDDIFSGDIALDYLVCPDEVFSFKSKSIK